MPTTLLASMADLFVNDIIGLLRRETGSEPEALTPEYFSSERLKTVRWLPPNLYRTGETVWAVDITRDDYLSPLSLEQMRAAKAADEHLRIVLLVPRGEPFERLMRLPEEEGFFLAIPAESGYQMLRPEPAAVPTPIAHPTRIPPNLADKVAALRNLKEPFRGRLCDFAESHRRLREDAPTDIEAREEQLLRDTLAGLIAIDNRFLGGCDPLEILRKVENLVRLRGANPRDHYFHSFHNLLLGCVVIDQMYTEFVSYHSYCMPGCEFSTEYAWLLTAVYHDTGYLIQHAAGIEDALYGDINPVGERSTTLPDSDLLRRQEEWNSTHGRIHRQQLVSLYDHLTQPDITSGWTAVTLLPGDVPEHGLDRALSENFMAVDTHGAASALRLIKEIEERLRPKASSQTLQFVMRHVYLAALSIPFHDWRLRVVLREAGIKTLSTRRFPLASLLMFIDSIQDDRREPSGLRFDRRDALQDIEVNGRRIIAVVDLGRVTSMEDKRIEAKGVKSFLVEDGLEFEYPPEFLDQNGE